MRKINLYNLGLIVLVFISMLSFSSCIFNKDIKQDTKLNDFRSRFHSIVDSVDNSTGKITALDSLIINIDEDKDIYSERKKNKLLTEVYNAVGNEYYSMESYDKAVEVLSKPIEINPNDADAYYNRGCAYQASEEYNQAIVDYNQAISINSNHTNAIYNRALIYESIGDHEHALSDYKKVINLNPSYKVEAYYKLGSVYQNMEMYDKALESFDKAIRLDSSSIEGYLMKGDVYLEQKTYDSVIVEYDKALKFSPDNVQIIYKRGKAYELNGDYDEARKDYEYVLQADSDETIGLEQAAKKGIRELSHVRKTSKLRARK